MSEPENNPPKKEKMPEDKENNGKPDSILKILDELFAHTNRSRRLFLTFIATALFFGPAAIILGGILLEHPDYSIRQLETQQGGGNEFRHLPPGAHLQIVDQNGTVIRELPTGQTPNRIHTTSIFLGLRVFIIISIIFAVILLLIAIKEYKFFVHWSQRFAKFKSLQEKVDKELGDE
ncbi:MAG: hypothetical protein WA833_07395 [Nitrosotalea sp.]